MDFKFKIIYAVHLMFQMDISIIYRAYRCKSMFRSSTTRKKRGSGISLLKEPFLNSYSNHEK